MTWEEAVQEYRRDPANIQGVRDNYFELPVSSAVLRYALSEEFAEILSILPPPNGGKLLDVGAGNGIASWAFAKQGWNVTALEPDDSAEVGQRAIRDWSSLYNSPVSIVSEVGELPLSDIGCYDVIFCRQVLHHLPNLESNLLGLARFLKPGGYFLAVREHVADDARQLQDFLERHPLHVKYGGEMAYPLETYLTAMRNADLEIKKLWGPWESIINCHPMTESQRRKIIASELQRRAPIFGRLFGNHPWVIARQARKLSQQDHSPGRLYSFLARKGQ